MGGAPRLARAPLRAVGGPVPITMLDAVTLPSLLLVPSAPMKLPTSRADALEPDDVPPGPATDVNVVAEE